MPEPRLVLGLDIGIASCGWALIDDANHRIIALGTHLWDAPQNDKDKKSLAKLRREARSSRRNVKRTADRKKNCLKLFKTHGLVPQDASQQSLQTVKGDIQPLEARVKALDTRVTDRELAQALYNICVRRGYIPHGSDGASNSEDGKVLKAIAANREHLEQSEYRTVGEMMLRKGQTEGRTCGSSRNKGGDYSHCVTLEQYVEEVEAIFDAQRLLGNPSASEELERDYLECLTWQKPSDNHDERVYSQVGLCTYFGLDDELPLEDRKAAAKACLSSELCIAHERFANVQIVNPDGTEQPLPFATRQECVKILFSPTPIDKNKNRTVSYMRLRKMLDLSASQCFKGIAADKEKEEVYKPRVWRRMREELPEELLQRMHDNRDLADRIGSALTYASTEKSLRTQLEALQLSDSETEAICSLPYNSKLFSGYGERSLMALAMLNDAFEDESISTLHDAEKASGLYEKRMGKLALERGLRLPPYASVDPTCKNPVVLRVMGRVRKLVNAVIAEYGLLDIIRIELARELKHSEKEKRSIKQSNERRETQRNRAKKKLSEELGCSPDEISGSLLRKYELWVEQDGVDLYTGDKIHYERLLEDDSYCQIDHILPYSRTCDDSQNNKILALNTSNQRKGNRSPYEWMHSGEEDAPSWEAFVDRLKGITYKKREKLLEQELEEKTGDFIKRNLNDTRYATRAAKDYLEDCLAFPDGGQHVFAVAGGATAALRNAWGFAKKNREKDDCHHAIDAAIIAMCNPVCVTKIAKASERKQLTPKAERTQLFANTEPWPGFAKAIEQAAAEIIPTRMVNNSVTGRLFEDTRYRFVGLNAKGTKALITSGGKQKSTGNYVFSDDGSVMLPDGIAFLRLWWDDTVKKPRYLAEPVYYADIDGIRHGTYQPRYAKAHSQRCDWPLIPEEVLKQKPIVLRYGQAFIANGTLYRFAGFNSDKANWIVGHPLSFKTKCTPPPISTKIKSRDDLRLVDEDILGTCFSTGQFKLPDSEC